MHSQRVAVFAKLEPKSYPLGQNTELSAFKYALALVALSHTPLEHRLYSAMLDASQQGTADTLFTVRSLVAISGIHRLSTIRRGLDGLTVKLSIELKPDQNGNGKREPGKVYRVYWPTEILQRRKQMGSLSPGVDYGNPDHGLKSNQAFERAVTRVADNPMLSRREAQVALCCVEGLTNAEIGKRLAVSDQTVKFHLRHVFLKFGVRRRAELISRLLM